MKTQRKYVVERMNNSTREWWTGEDWSEVDTEADWYTERNVAQKVAEAVGGSPTAFEVDLGDDR